VRESLRAFFNDPQRLSQSPLFLILQSLLRK
jgi:hypothetical protein